MEIRYYLDGKCVFSYDDNIFSTDEDYINIIELFIDPVRDMVYKKYYEKDFVLQRLEKVLKENDVVFQIYCEIKPLIENEEIDVDYLQDCEETLLKKLMRDKLSSNEFENFIELLDTAGKIVDYEERKFLVDMSSMSEHFWVKKINN